MKHWKFLVGLALTAILSGCGSIPGMKQDSGAHVVCTHERQEGCITLEVANLKWEAHPLTAGLDQPYASEEERQRRAQFLPPLVHEAYAQGELTASAPRAFLVHVFEGVPVPAENLSVYQGKLWIRADAEDVTETVKHPTFEPDKGPGKLTRIYRVRTGERDSGFIGIQFPRSMLRDGTGILVCTEDSLAVYPNRVTGDQGLWVKKESVAWLQKKGSTRWMMFFLSIDKPAAQAAGRGAK